MSISPCNGRQRVVLETCASLIHAVARFSGLEYLFAVTRGVTPQALCCRQLPQSY